MKNTAIIIFLLFLFCACAKKEYRCSCVVSCNDTTVVTEYEFKAKQKDAGQACNAYETLAGTCAADCRLK